MILRRSWSVFYQLSLTTFGSTKLDWNTFSNIWNRRFINICLIEFFLNQKSVSEYQMLCSVRVKDKIIFNVNIFYFSGSSVLKILSMLICIWIKQWILESIFKYFVNLISKKKGSREVFCWIHLCIFFFSLLVNNNIDCLCIW